MAKWFGVHQNQEVRLCLAVKCTRGPDVLNSLLNQRRIFFITNYVPIKGVVTAALAMMSDRILLAGDQITNHLRKKFILKSCYAHNGFSRTAKFHVWDEAFHTERPLLFEYIFSLSNQSPMSFLVLLLVPRACF